MTATIFILLWLASGIFGAFYCTMWNVRKASSVFSRGDLISAIIASLFGPVMLVGALMAFFEKLDQHPFWNAPLFRKDRREP